jgi:hypothetical protein
MPAGAQRLVAQHRAQRGDLLGLPLRQVDKGPVLDLAVNPISSNYMTME